VLINSFTGNRFHRLILLKGGHVHAMNFGAQFKVGLPGVFLKS